MSKKKTHEEYVEELLVKNPTVKVVGKYIDAKTKIPHHCDIHNILWDISPDGALAGHGCYICHKERKNHSLRKTHEEYVLELSIKNPNVEALERYINSETKILHRCKIHNKLWSVSPDCALRGYGCSQCCVEKIKDSQCKTHNGYVLELQYINPNIEVTEKYINAKTPILHHCKIHDEYWSIAPTSALQGNGCTQCHRERQSLSLRKSQKQYEEDVFAINSNIIVLGEYIHSHSPLLHKCKICGFEWSPWPTSVLSGKGCPHCNQSRGERIIKSYLDDNNIRYLPQHRFND